MVAHPSRDDPYGLNIGFELVRTEELGLSLRSASVHFAFGVLLGLVAIVARAVSLTTRGPWFTPNVSIQVYSVTMLGSMFLAVAIVALASFQAAHLDEVLLSMEMRTAVLSQMTGVELWTAENDQRPSSRSASVGLDEVLDGLDGPLDGGAPAVRLAQDTVVLTEMSVPVGSRPVADVQREIVSRYRAVQSARDRVWLSVIGPLAASLCFLASAGAMLPGAEGFAQTNFQLNTMLVLFLGYGWVLLLWWAVATLLMLPSASRQRKVFHPRLWETVE
jgi:hypothetical protein